MGDSSKNFDADKLFSYSVDLVKVLKDNRDISNLTQCLENFKSLSSSCDVDYNEVRSLLEGQFLCFSLIIILLSGENQRKIETLGLRFETLGL